MILFFCISGVFRQVQEFWAILWYQHSRISHSMSFVEFSTPNELNSHQQKWRVNYPCHQIYMYLLILWMTLGWSFDIHSPFFMKNLSMELPIRSGWLSSHWLLLWIFWSSLLHTINYDTYLQYFTIHYILFIKPITNICIIVHYVNYNLFSSIVLLSSLVANEFVIYYQMMLIEKVD